MRNLVDFKAVANLLKRSKGSSLALDIDLSKWEQNTCPPHLLYGGAGVLYRMDITFGANRIPFLQQVLAKSQPLLQAAKLVNLDNEKPVHLQNLFAQSPKLRELRLSAITSGSIQSFTGLVHLEVWNLEHFNPLPLLAKMRNLDICGFSIGELLSEESERIAGNMWQKVQLSALRKLTLRGALHSCVYVMDRIDFPTSTYISLTTSRNVESFHLMRSVASRISKPTWALTMLFDYPSAIRFVGPSIDWTVEHFDIEDDTTDVVCAVLEELKSAKVLTHLEARFGDENASMYFDWDSELLTVLLKNLTWLDIALDCHGNSLFYHLNDLPPGVVGLPKLRTIVARVVQSNEPEYERALSTYTGDHRVQRLASFLQTRMASKNPIKTLHAVMEDKGEEFSKEEEVMFKKEVEACSFSRELNVKDLLQRRNKEVNPSTAW